MKNTGRPYYVSFSSPEQPDYEILDEFNHDLFEMSLERYIDGYQVSLVGNRTTKCLFLNLTKKPKTSMI